MRFRTPLIYSVSPSPSHFTLMLQYISSSSSVVSRASSALSFPSSAGVLSGSVEPLDVTVLGHALESLKGCLKVIVASFTENLPFFNNQRELILSLWYQNKAPTPTQISSLWLRLPPLTGVLDPAPKPSCLRSQLAAGPPPCPARFRRPDSARTLLSRRGAARRQRGSFLRFQGLLNKLL